MPFLSGLGQAKIGRGFFASGRIPGPPTFANAASAASENNAQLPVTFTPPVFNGRIRNYWIQIFSINFIR